MSLNNDTTTSNRTGGYEPVYQKKPILPPTRVFSGGRAIAYMDDLRLLHEQFVKWLTGDGAQEFGQYGYLPLNEQGRIDTGMIDFTICDHGVAVGQNQTKINFSGNLLYVSKDPDTGMVTVKCNFPDIYAKYSMLGSDSGIYPGLMTPADELKARVFDVVAAESTVDYSGVYGEFEKGQVIPAVARKASPDMFVWKTVFPVALRNSTGTRFHVYLYTGADTVVVQTVSSPVAGDTANALNTHPENLYLKVSNYRQCGLIHSCELELGVDMSLFVQESRACYVKVVQYNSYSEASSLGSGFGVVRYEDSDEDETVWKSDPLFYISDSRQQVNPLVIDAAVQSSAEYPAPSVVAGSGIKFVQDGYVRFTVTGIDYINYPVIMARKLRFQSNIIDQEYVFSDEDIDYGDYSPFDVQAKNAVWSHVFRIKPGVVYPGPAKVTAKISYENGFEKVEKEWDDVRVMRGGRDAFIDTCRSLSRYSTCGTVEAFDGVNYRYGADDFYMEQYPEYAYYVQGTQLQVVPFYGLVWPNVFGPKNLTYCDRYFKRVFNGSQDDTTRAFGGAFRIGGLKKDRFLNGDVRIKLSFNQGQTWYSLNDERQGENQMGIMTECAEKDDYLLVKFALPLYMSFRHDAGVRFWMSYSQDCKSEDGDFSKDVRITYILFRNEDDTREF